MTSWLEQMAHGMLESKFQWQKSKFDKVVMEESIIIEELIVQS